MSAEKRLLQRVHRGEFDEALLDVLAVLRTEPRDDADAMPLIDHLVLDQLIVHACFAGAQARRTDLLEELKGALASDGWLARLLIEYQQSEAVPRAQAFVACWQAAAAAEGGDLGSAMAHVRRAVGLLAGRELTSLASALSPACGRGPDGRPNAARQLQAACLDLHRDSGLPPDQRWVIMAVGDAVREMLGHPRQVVRN